MDAFVTRMLERMGRGELPVRRSTPGRDTKWTYHFGATDPESGRTVIGVGSDGMGDDFGWGKEISPAEVEFYLGDGV